MISKHAHVRYYDDCKDVHVHKRILNDIHKGAARPMNKINGAMNTTSMQKVVAVLF